MWVLFFLLDSIHCTKIDHAYFLNQLDKPLPEVSNLTVSRNANGVILTWKNPIDVNFFKILILKSTSETSDRPKPWLDYPNSTLINTSQVVYNAAASTFIDTEIKENVIYFYKVFAYDTYLYYNLGTQISFEDKQPPKNITNYSLQSNLDKIILNWDNPTDFDFSKVLILKNRSVVLDVPVSGQSYAINASIGNSRVVYNSNIETFTDTEVTEGATYHYKLFATDKSFNYTSGVKVKRDKIPPKNITNDAFQSNLDGITLTWNNPTDSDFFGVLILKKTSMISNAPISGQSYTVNNSIDGSQVAYKTTTPIFTDTETEAGIVYYYKIFTYDTSFNYSLGIAISGRRAVDNDHDGLIEIYTAKMLNNMRYDPAGARYKTSANDPGDMSGCPNSGCNGYELTANIDLLSLLDGNDTDSDPNNHVAPNGKIDTVIIGFDKNNDRNTTDADERITVIDTSKDKNWAPIGNSSTNSFTGIFEGNNHTITNLWINFKSLELKDYAGLFGVVGKAGKTVEIRNVRIISGSMYSSTNQENFHSGGLVALAQNDLTIINSYFSGSMGSSSSGLAISGGLVAETSNGNLTIKNSYFSGGEISSTSRDTQDSYSYSGGLVGQLPQSTTLTITNCYFSGEKISSFSSSGSYSGGLVASTSGDLTIINSYFGDGRISSSSSSSNPSLSGGLLGELISSSSYMFENSYWNKDAPQSVNSLPQNPRRAWGSGTNEPAGTTSITLEQLKATSGMYPSNLLLPIPSIGDVGNAWDLGTANQLPAIKLCVPTITNDVTNWTMCASYGDLLAGQR